MYVIFRTKVSCGRICLWHLLVPFIFLLLLLIYFELVEEFTFEGTMQIRKKLKLVSLVEHQQNCNILI